MWIVLVLLLAVADTLDAYAQQFTQQPVLDDIYQQTSQRAQDEQPQPYYLPRQFGAPPGQRIAIYTTETRVAMAAYRDWQLRRERKVNELPAWLLSRNVLVVFRTPCRPASDCDFSNATEPFKAGMPVSRVFSGPLLQGDDTTLGAMDAVSMSENLAILEEIGGTPFENAGVVAFFEPTAMRAGASLAAMWFVGSKTTYFVGGRVTAADVARLRVR